LKSLETAKLQAYLQGSVGPRPIAFASTVDEMETKFISV
jgi:hypothetical protein